MAGRLARRIMLVGTLAAALGSPAARGGTAVYSNDFEKGAGAEWSMPQTDVTPKGDRHFLGPFTTNTVALRLEKLPKHKYLRITFDVYVGGTWDGNAVESQYGRVVGPDAWRMNVAEGKPEPENRRAGEPAKEEVEGAEPAGILLVDTTFSNFDQPGDRVVKEAQTQNFPSILPGESHPARTGAIENNTLGYQWVGRNGGRELDTVYRISCLLPHTADRVRFNFWGGGGMAVADDEVWGLDNLKVEALEDGDLRPLDEVAMRKFWETVGGQDVAAETEAYWRLVEGGDGVAKFLRGKVKRAGIDKKQFGQWVRELDGDDFQAREKATESIRNMGPAAEGLLREAIDQADTAEVKLRLETALRTLAKTPPNDPETRRHTIALKILRAIGTPEAIRVAGELSGK